MAKAIIVYFSQNGTTERVADSVAAGLRNAGYVVDSWNMRDGHPPDIRDYDLMGIGSPVYYYRLPFNVADYLRTLPKLDGKPAFCFLVYGSHIFDAANWLRRRLERLETKEVGFFSCRGEAHFLGHLREGYLFSPDHPTQDELERATAFGNAVAKDKRMPFPDAPKAPLLYRIERAAMSQLLVEQVYSRLFKVDHNRCTACGLCMESCPTRNIEKDPHGHPRWGRRCLYCLSCEMNCPEDAISSAISRPGLRLLMRPFLRYHATRWSQEPDLDHVRVVHRHGRTERL